MNEKEVLEMKFGESVADGNGNRYTKTIGGWIYSTFAGQLCFIPDVKENLTTENNAEAKTKKTKVEK